MSQIQHITFTVPRTAHCYQLGPTNGTAAELWLVCHGYGQLARHFIRRFDAVLDGRRLIVAPQGLSLFYTKGTSGQPGASWMTREARLSEIDDYCIWLQLVYTYYLRLCRPGARVFVFGFSQGCATAMRYVTRCRPHFDLMMLWAGLTPEDIDYTPFREWLAERSLWTAMGTTDPYLTPERQAWQLRFFEAQGLPFHIFRYEGGHELSRQALLQWLSHLKGQT